MYHWNAWAFAQSSVAGYLSNRMRSPTYESSPNVHHHHHHHHHPSHQTYQPEALIIPTYGTMVATSAPRPLFSLRWTCQDLLPRREVNIDGSQWIAEKSSIWMITSP